MEWVERDDDGCVNHATPVPSVYQSRKGLSMGIPHAGSDAGRRAAADVSYPEQGGCRAEDSIADGSASPNAGCLPGGMRVT